jgi:hypothetical protein
MRKRNAAFKSELTLPLAGTQPMVARLVRARTQLPPGSSVNLNEFRVLRGPQKPLARAPKGSSSQFRKDT